MCVRSCSVPLTGPLEAVLRLSDTVKSFRTKANKTDIDLKLFCQLLFQSSEIKIMLLARLFWGQVYV